MQHLMCYCISIYTMSQAFNAFFSSERSLMQKKYQGVLPRLNITLIFQLGD